MKEKLLIVLPTYNEAGNIKAVLNGILSIDRPIDVLVIDDNSPDNTTNIVEAILDKNKRIYLIKRPKKLGLASAYKEGFNYGLLNKYSYIMQMDADLSHDPEDIPRFLEYIKNYDCVIGSRYVDGIRVINWPLHRLILSYSASVYTRAITGLKLHDATSGFKCIRREALEMIDLNSLRSEGYGFNIELSYICQKKGLRTIEIPIVFSERFRGRSKLSNKIIYEAAALVWRLPFKKY
jgi:dolichol-phosphate mannosyltransferase